MNKIKVYPTEIKNILKKNLKDKNTVFVFPTNVDKDSWIEWVILHSEESGVSCVPLEQFLPWDKFKINFMTDKQSGKNQIPSLLKKIFVHNLIKKNAQGVLQDKPVFKSIIKSQYAQRAYSFTDWITQNLSSLNLWYKKYNQWISKNNIVDTDEENLDYLTLYNEYKNFLDQNNLFEPSWEENILIDTNKKFFIFYPEIIEDFDEYKMALEKNANISLIMLPEESKSNFQKAYKFNDSRSELRRILLKIRNLVEQKKCNYTDIALNIPNLEIYIPYIKREAKKYCVPISLRFGKKLTQNSSGAIFIKFEDFINTNYSFDSVRSLLLDNYIPWKYPSINEKIIREGNRLHCLCNYDQTDNWEKILENLILVTEEDGKNYSCLKYYKDLKRDIKDICQAKSFDKILSSWFKFKYNFLEEDGFDTFSDNILSRCIIHLQELCQIEKDFFVDTELTINSPYSFFIDVLQNTTYAEQTELNGVSVFPYKLAAVANYKYQFIIDSSQKNLNISYKRLSFLNNTKREKLGLLQEDKRYNVSNAFINLYAKNKLEDYVQFSYAEDTFNGYAIAHNFLLVEKEKNPLQELDENDFFITEKKLFFDLGREKNINRVVKLSKEQKKSLERWLSTKIHDKTDVINPIVVQKINKVLKGLRLENLKNNLKDEEFNSDIIILTQSDMKYFFPCQRRWLYSRIFKLSEDSLDTELLGRFDLGNIKHNVLEKIMLYFNEKNIALPKVVGKEFENCDVDVKSLIDKYLNEVLDSYYVQRKIGPIIYDVLKSQLTLMAKQLYDFLIRLSSSSPKISGFESYNIFAAEKAYFSTTKTKNVYLFGEIDCILQKKIDIKTSLEEEKIKKTNCMAIVDYKNYSVPALKDTIVNEEQVLNNFQMAVYYKLLSENEKNNYINSGRFYSIDSDKKIVCFDFEGNITSVIFGDTINALEEYIQNFYEKYQQKDFTPKTTSNKKNNVEKNECYKCNYKNICRYTYEVAANVLEKEEDE